MTNTQQAFSLLGIEEKRKKIKLIDKHTTPELVVWRACLTQLSRPDRKESSSILEHNI